MPSQYTCNACKTSTTIHAPTVPAKAAKKYICFRETCPKCNAVIFVVVDADGTIKTALINFSQTQ